MTTKRKILLVLLPVLTLLMGFVPGAVRMRWQTNTEIIYTYHSYADLLPVGYANFTPLLTLILTGILLILFLFWLYLDEGWTAVRILTVLAAGMAGVSFILNLTGTGYFSAVGLVIFVLLAIQLITVFSAKRN